MPRFQRIDWNAASQVVAVLALLLPLAVLVACQVYFVLLADFPAQN